MGNDDEEFVLDAPSTLDDAQFVASSALVAAARAVAFCVHEGQADKLGNPYMRHVCAVAARCHEPFEKAVAYLHDTVEDTQVTLASLRKAGFPENVVDAVDYLTKRDGEAYADYIMRVAGNPLAVRVKLADLADHLDPAFAAGLDESHKRRYGDALAYLQKFATQTKGTL